MPNAQNNPALYTLVFLTSSEESMSDAFGQPKATNDLRHCLPQSLFREAIALNVAEF